MATPLYQQAKLAFDKGGLPGVFLEVLGWDSRPNDNETFLVDNVPYVGTKVASVLNGIVVFEFDFQQAGIVTPSQQKEIAKAVGRKYAERLVVFKTKAKSTWLWPKKTSGGALTFEKLEAPSDSLPTFLAQRLVALSISNEEFDKGVTLPQIREKLRGSFDTSTITKKFYERFRNQHQELAKAISGLDADQTNSYATLLLNRLMFIYFLQKKEFLNGDPNYLRNCLNKVSDLKGEGKFFSFYKDLLLELFFEGLNKKDGTFKPAEIASIIGKVPYINGGIFGESELENSNDISVPDEVFADIFNFFDSFTWHLDTRPTGKSDEINPEVIGYIFEQYINYTAGGKKENGAYYTKQDVTGYMVGQTLVPRILDMLVASGLSPIQLVVGSGDRYINDYMLHGWNSEIDNWEPIRGDLEKIWLGDPGGWEGLDKAEHDPKVSLPSENLVETFHRRDRVGKLRDLISEGKLATINDLTTRNLNSQLLVLDAIDSVDSGEDFEQIWNLVENLSVIDPTCGSGAFLFAALEVLEDIYSHLIDAAEELSSRSQFAKSLVEKVSQHPNRRYFIRKQAALNNIYGTDLMSEAVETAKLRVFLALASCLDSTKEIEPLPDLDFNLKSGNLVVGFKDEDDAYRVGGNQIIAKSQIDLLAPKISTYVDMYTEFVSNSKNNLTTASEKTRLRNQSQNLRDEADSIYAECVGVDSNRYATWRAETKPFHWFAEFPQIIGKGGFDVIIGNPPYIKMSEIKSVDILGYKSSKAPDFYAVCLERALQLLHPKGRLSMVVMSSIANGSKFGVIRELISNEDRAEWWSTFGRIPEGLFTSTVRVRNAILIIAPGKLQYSTRNHIFNANMRPWLFGCIEYAPSRRKGAAVPNRGGVAHELMELIQNSFTRDGFDEQCFVRLTGAYWFPVLFEIPPILDSSLHVLTRLDDRVQEVKIPAGIEKDSAVAYLGGMITYLWWATVGNDFDTKSFQAEKPLAFAGPHLKNLEVSKISKEIKDEALKHCFASPNAGKLYVNIRWSSLLSETNKLDRMVLELSGNLHLWRPLNVFYRQIMKSSGVSFKAKKISAEAAGQILPSDSSKPV